VLVKGKAKKTSTLSTDRGRIERHIKPLIGSWPAAAIDRGDVEGFMHKVAGGETAARVKTGRHGLARVSGGKGTATRTVGLLGAIFTFAVRRKMRPDNPVQGIQRYADGRRDRRLTNEEYAALGEATRQAVADGNIWPAAIAMVRFLAVTGWRTGEAVNLTWENVDLARRTARLPDTKTGESARPLSHAACDLLKSLPRLGAGHVFPSSRGKGPMTGFKKIWPRITALGAIPKDITPHVLRHSFASEAGDLEYSEATIAALVGHKGHSITRRYVHSADAVLLAAADAVATRISFLMGEEQETAHVISLRASG
jgi:integrase